MNYHKIITDDQLNGDGLRVVLFVSGCNHHCKGCQNPQTWNPNSGQEFTDKDKEKILEMLSEDYISGITLSGGDPLYPANIDCIYDLIKSIRNKYDITKDIWLYTGYKFEDILPFFKELLKNINVLVDGEFIEELADKKYKWAGSTNQRVIDVQQSLNENTVVLYK
jgi:anaerobic ribonucleoside-triphosphate reductase activating protein